MTSIGHILDWLFSVGIAVGPSAAYLPQYFQIQKDRNHKAFSSVICFILLTANISRLCCFILDKYPYSLFVQSILMILVQLTLLHLLVRLKTRDILPVSSKSSSQDDEIDQQQQLANLLPVKRSYFSSFWSWPSFIEYIFFLVGFTAIFLGLIGIHLAFHRALIPASIFLFFSTGIESTLCMPQLWTNYRNKSTAGLNKTLVLTWLLGDAIKLYYYIHSSSQLPFILCAIIQIFVDFLIIGQIVYYNQIRKRQPSAELSRPPSAVPLTEEKEEKMAESPQILNKN